MIRNRRKCSLHFSSTSLSHNLNKRSQMFSSLPQIRHIQKQDSSLGRHILFFSKQIKKDGKHHMTLSRRPARSRRTNNPEEGRKPRAQRLPLVFLLKNKAEVIPESEFMEGTDLKISLSSSYCLQMSPLPSPSERPREEAQLKLFSQKQFPQIRGTAEENGLGNLHWYFPGGSLSF